MRCVLTFVLVDVFIVLMTLACCCASIHKRATDRVPPLDVDTLSKNSRRTSGGQWLHHRRRIGAHDVRRTQTGRRHRQRHVPNEFYQNLSSQANSPLNEFSGNQNPQNINKTTASHHVEQAHSLSSSTFQNTHDVNNALSSLPSNSFRKNHKAVDLHSNRFFDPSIKITIEVLHEKGHPNQLDPLSDPKDFTLEVEGISAEKRKQLQTILSSIDSPLDGSQRIHGSGLFSTSKALVANRHRKHKRRPHRRKGRGKRRRKKHKHIKDPLVDGSSPWSSWGPCSATCGQGTRERNRKCGPRCHQSERAKCYSLCHTGLTDVSPSSPFEDLILGSSGPRKQLDSSTDQCQQWIDCKDSFMISYLKRLSNLPSCPCEYPLNLRTRITDKVFDDFHQRDFRWLDASSEKDRLDIYQRGATYCIRSRLDFSIGLLGSQQCCYDADMHLLTRGSGAGTPELVNPELSTKLHYRMDVLPWIICKGDWTRYHQARKPNNAQHCRDNPDAATLEKQRERAKKF